MTDDVTEGAYYFDHAAGSYPKPEMMIQAMSNFLRQCAISPGHAGHRLAKKSAMMTMAAKETIANFIGVKDLHQVIFSMNATFAINQVLRGVLKAGDHVIYTTTEHNSILRCLNSIKDHTPISLTQIPCNQHGELFFETIEKEITTTTKLIIANYASNVTGIINPIEKIISIAKKRQIKTAIDAVQTTGYLKVDIEKLGCDFLFFTGHKGLLGPTGVGGAYIKDGELVDAVIVGGTGTNSASTYHPILMPEKFEAGTGNALNIVGLAAGIDYINERGVDEIFSWTKHLAQLFVEGLNNIPEIITYGTCTNSPKTAVVAFNIKGYLPVHIAEELDSRYGIMVRAGLHCAPLIHKDLGTYPHGTMRVSFGFSNTLSSVDYLLSSIKDLIRTL